MDDNPEIELKKICCTCLSVDRKLFQLCKLNNGVNNLYSLLSYDSEAYKEGFYKDLASLYVCWECRGQMSRVSQFRHQACVAQKLLSNIVDGKARSKSFKPLSTLTTTHKTAYDLTIISRTADIITDNFIDCNAVDDIKTEVDYDDIPLSELNHYDVNSYIPDDNPKSDCEKITAINNYSEGETKDLIPKTRHKKIKKKEKHKKKTRKKDKELYKTIVMSEKDMLESRERRKMAVGYADAASKCGSCVEGFKSQIELDEHNQVVHTEKPDHSQCDVCLAFTPIESLVTHKENHYFQYNCILCDYIGYTLNDTLRHLRGGHSIRSFVPSEKQGERRTPRVRNPGSKPRRSVAMLDKRTPYGYQCAECNKYFENKNQRWKHVQRHHREGFRCHTCGKRFAFKNNLTRHEQLHQGPPPREECPTCHKMIRVDLLKIHARIHSTRETHSCAACDKTFVSRASYHHHLKYTQAHANIDILKYKCGMCDKGYRSRGELRDHENYQHRGETQHKCPVCGKALATRRCITRHVRRAHHGIKESARDKICQQCGKAFRDKKGLREHEFIHTGERPLSCEVCGGTFRQSASLYTHKRRVHKIHAPRRHARLMSPQP